MLLHPVVLKIFTTRGPLAQPATCSAPELVCPISGDKSGAARFFQQRRKSWVGFIPHSEPHAMPFFAQPLPSAPPTLAESMTAIFILVSNLRS
jgi:hypothetical protein